MMAKGVAKALEMLEERQFKELLELVYRRKKINKAVINHLLERCLINNFKF